MTEPATGPFRPVVLAPTYNNAATLVGILDRIEATGLPILVVNDGSTDQTPHLLEAWAHPAPPGPPRRVAVHVITHPRNRGKAEALNTGFEAAARLGYTHVATIDTDGQLDPESLPSLVEVARRSPRALVLGVRSESIEGYPARSLAGRRLSNLAIRCEAGVTIEDSQCGLRVYPLALFDATRCRARRYAFEAEVLTRAAWAGFPIEQVPVPCRYFPKDERVSHFKPGRDSWSGLRLHLRLLGEALLPWRRPASPAMTDHHRAAAAPAAPWDDASLFGPDEPGEHPIKRLLRRFGAWIDPVDVWRQIRSDPVARSQVAIGFSIGAFIANLPIYGLQTLSCLYVARRLHLHPLPVVLGSQVSTPPLSPILIAAAIITGHAFLHGTWVQPADLDPTSRGLATTVASTLLDWTVGGVVIGAVMAAASFLAARFVLRLIPFREDQPGQSPAGNSTVATS
jgi:uncharacterized protein (DUF2062 family)